MAHKILELRNIKKSYGDNVILDHYNLSVNENEFVTFLGPSGCGKTTILRIIGGFETMQEGQLLLDGVEIQDLPAHKRPINTVSNVIPFSLIFPFSITSRSDSVTTSIPMFMTSEP